MEAHTFWMVWREHSGSTHYQHSSRASADEEAKRLAASCPDERFFVLKAATAYHVETTPPQRVKLIAPAHHDDIPF